MIDRGEIHVILINGMPRRSVRIQPSSGDPDHLNPRATSSSHPPQNVFPPCRFPWPSCQLRAKSCLSLRCCYPSADVAASACGFLGRCWPLKGGYHHPSVGRVERLRKGRSNEGVQHCKLKCQHEMFDKVPQLTTDASFTGDLGLDSLDAVEVVMAVEEVC